MEIFTLGVLVFCDALFDFDLSVFVFVVGLGALVFPSVARMSMEGSEIELSWSCVGGRSFWVR